MKPFFNSKHTIVLVVSIMIVSLSQAQVKINLKKPVRRITLDVVDIALEDLLELLQKDMEIPVAYAVDNIPTGILITIHVNEVLLAEFFELVCRRAKLNCEFLDGYYILKYGDRPDPVAIIREEETEGANAETTIREPSKYIDQQESSALIDDHADNLPDKDFLSYEKISNIRPSLQPVQRQKTSLNYSAPDHPVEYNEDRKNKSLYLSVVYGIDLHQFHFKPGLTTDQYFESKWNYSLGLSGNFGTPLNKFRISPGILFSQKDFTYAYNYRVLDLDDPIPIPDITTVQHSYLEIPIVILYQFISGQKLTGSLSAGFHPSFLVKKNETTSYQNTEEQETDYYLSQAQSFLKGASIGLELTYPLNKKWRAVIQPQFIQYFQPVNSQAMKSNTRLFSIKTGLAFSII